MAEPAPPSDGRRLTAVLVALGWGAAVVAANGFVSLFTGLEVDPLRNAGPLVVPVAVVAALVALLVRLLRAHDRTGWLPLECGALVYLVQLAVGAAVYLLLRGSPADGVLWIATQAASPFQLADTVLALVAGLIMLLVLRAQAAGARRPRWPWERDDDA
ncbi:MAG TPA: DUF6121 family protein [Amnibacterium sp.]|jgi:uncharacterized membrane protein YhaH (DUF805 family)|nr:DUF6121 family protein [Amnibacterium sp.]